jgi:hypothetical protein
MMIIEKPGLKAFTFTFGWRHLFSPYDGEGGEGSNTRWQAQAKTTP